MCCRSLRLFSGLVLTWVLVWAGSAYAAESAIDTVDRWLLTSSDAARIKVAAKNLVAEPARPTSTFDLAATVLDRHLKNIAKLDEDTAAWVLRALGASHSLRYRELIDRSRQGGKLTRFADGAVAELKTDAPPWTTDTVDLDRTRAALIEQRQRGPAPSAVQFSDVRVGVALETMWPTLGLPDDIAITVSNSYLHEWTYRLPNASSPFFSTNTSVTVMVFEYRSLGRVVLDRYGSGWVVSSTSATSTASTVAGTSTLLLQQFSTELRSSDPAVVRKSARHMVDMLVDDEGVLAEAGKVVIENLSTENDEMIDAMSLLCRAIGQSSNPDTQNVLLRVSKEAKSRKLRRWSGDIYEKIEERRK